MKIESKYPQNTAPISSRTPQIRSNASPAASAEAVSLSPLAETLQSGEKPPVNSARIQEIKNAIAQGHFKINPEAIANGLIDTARDLVNSQRKV